MEGEEPDRGVKLYRQAQRKRSLAFAISLGLAGLAACAVAYVANRADAIARPIDPMLASAIALCFVGSFAAANWLYLRSSDELVWEDNVRASFWGLAVLVILYPAWLVLHAGGIVPPPNAKGLWAGTIGAAGVVYAWRRLRSR
jgi:hypothetical protein